MPPTGGLTLYKGVLYLPYFFRGLGNSFSSARYLGSYLPVLNFIRKQWEAPYRIRRYSDAYERLVLNREIDLYNVRHQIPSAQRELHLADSDLISSENELSLFDRTYLGDFERTRPIKSLLEKAFLTSYLPAVREEYKPVKLREIKTPTFSRMTDDDIINFLKNRGQNGGWGVDGLMTDENGKIVLGYNFGRGVKEMRYPSGGTPQLSLLRNEKGDPIIQTEDLNLSTGFDPSRAVSTHVDLPSYEDPSLPNITGEIRFDRYNGVGTSNMTLNLGTGELIINRQTLAPTGEWVVFPDGARERLTGNIHLVQKLMPGFMPFGSAVGVAEMGFPHATADIDGYMTLEDVENFMREHPEIKYTKLNDNTYTFHLFPELNNPDGVHEHLKGDIDVNILMPGSKEGTSSGERAWEMFRQFDPLGYQKRMLEITELYRQGVDARTSNPELFDVPHSPKDLLGMYDPSVKTFMDLLEINPEGAKEKQLMRPLVYFHEADPKVLGRGLDLFSKMIAGEGVRDFAPIEMFLDVEQNLKLLKSLGLEGLNAERIAVDPEKTRNIMNYWFLNLTVHGRGARFGGKDLLPLKQTIGLFYPMYEGGTVVHPDAGGLAMGAGRNTVLLGDSGHGDFYDYDNPAGYGFWQVPIEFDPTLDAYSRFLKTLRETGDNRYQFTPEERQAIISIQRKHGIDPTRLIDPKNPEELLQSSALEYYNSSEWGNVLSDIEKELGIKSLIRDEGYGSGRYSSMTSDTPENDILIFLKDRRLGSFSPMDLSIRDKRLSRGLDLDFLRDYLKIPAPLPEKLFHISESSGFPIFLKGQSDWFTPSWERLIEHGFPNMDTLFDLASTNPYDISDERLLQFMQSPTWLFAKKKYYPAYDVDKAAVQQAVEDGKVRVELALKNLSDLTKKERRAERLRDESDHKWYKKQGQVLNDNRTEAMKRKERVVKTGLAVGTTAVGAGIIYNGNKALNHTASKHRLRQEDETVELFKQYSKELQKIDIDRRQASIDKLAASKDKNSASRRHYDSLVLLLERLKEIYNQ